MTDISLLFEPPFARIVLNRPERRNAISRAMWRALPAIRAAIEARQDALVVLVEGEGGHFSAGADISEFDEVYRDASATRDYGDAIQDGLNALIDLDRPDNRGLAGERGRRRSRAGARLRLCASAQPTPIWRSRRPSSGSFTATPKRAASSNSSDLRGRRTSCSPGGGSRPRRRSPSDSIDRRVETALHDTVLGYARGLADLSQASIRGGKRAVDAIAAGMTVETPAFRALAESAALGPDFARGASGVLGEASRTVFVSRRDGPTAASLAAEILASAHFGRSGSSARGIFASGTLALGICVPN